MSSARRVLLHLVDAAGDDPIEAWRVVRGELDAYGAGLEDKPEVVALSRSDLVDAEGHRQARGQAAKKASGTVPFDRLRRDRRRARALLDAILERLGGARPTRASQRRCRGGASLVAALKLAITGATGFVGARLLDCGAAMPVTASARSPAGRSRRATASTWVEGALDDLRALDRLARAPTR